MELHEYSMGLYGIPWNSIDTPLNSMAYPWNSMDTPWISMEFHGGISHGLLCVDVAAFQLLYLQDG